jgi:general secretion pathway protein G
MRLPLWIRRLWPLGLLLGVACALAFALLVLRAPQSVHKAKEAVLREDLWILRDSIQQFHERHHAYPEALDDLVAEGYIQFVPVDPMTNSADTWILKNAVGGRGIADVRSGAEGKSIEGVPYSEL